MQIPTLQNGFETFECKFELLERDSMHSNPNSNRDRKVSHANSKHSKEIRSIRMQILTIRKEFEAFQSKFERFDRDSNPSNEIRSIQMHILAIERDSSHSNANCNHSNKI